MHALIMIPPSGDSVVERWVATGRREAAHHLVHILQACKSTIPIHILTAEKADRNVFEDGSVASIKISKSPFHFGEALCAFVRDEQPETMLYFGAGSAPLVSFELIEQALSIVGTSKNPKAYVNNFHSTDWAIFNHAQEIIGMHERLPQDNQLGWVMKNKAGYEIAAAPFTLETSVNIDTPMDLLMIAMHPSKGQRFKDMIPDYALAALQRVEAFVEVMQKPGNTIAIIGRSSSHIWAMLEQKTKLWLRVFVEERGMVASGRLERGEVRSLVGELVMHIGHASFVRHLASICDAVLWDTRVWMGHQGIWPSQVDRFAADLGLTEEIQDQSLRSLTRAVVQADIPIITGGHGVVAGNILALLKKLEEG